MISISMGLSLGFARSGIFWISEGILCAIFGVAISLLWTLYNYDKKKNPTQATAEGEVNPRMDVNLTTDTDVTTDDFKIEIAHKKFK